MNKNQVKLRKLFVGALEEIKQINEHSKMKANSPDEFNQNDMSKLFVAMKKAIQEKKFVNHSFSSDEEAEKWLCSAIKSSSAEKKNKPYIFSKIFKAIRLALSNPSKTVIFIACLLAITYFSLSLYEGFKPKSYKELYMHCLELGSNMRTQLCLRQLGSNK